MSLISTSTRLPRMAFWFRQPGLSGRRGTVSMEVQDLPGTYLWYNRADGKIHLKARSEGTPDFDRDATFTLKPALFVLRTISFGQQDQPHIYIRHYDSILFFNSIDSSTLARADASWTLKRKTGKYAICLFCQIFQQ